MITARLSILMLGLLAATARAEIYELPPQGYDVIGAVSAVSARHEDTLVDIARRHGLGYEDIVRANPDLNPWLPGEGAEVVLPTRFVLPPGPRTGVVLNLAEYRLYYYPPAKSGETRYVMTYPISIGRMDWETPLGITEIVNKVVDPAWYPPKSVREEHAADGKPLPAVVPAGPDNPLGRFAMRLSMPGYLIHSTNRPAGVGMRVSHGCIRMLPEDIEFLFGLIDVNTKVRIINEPLKFGWSGDELVMESHPRLEASDKDPLNDVTALYISATGERAGELDWHLAEEIVVRADGIPTAVGRGNKDAATSAASIKNAATSAAFE